MSNYKTVFFTLGILQIILGLSFSFVIIVEPVVVIPDMLSKKASVKLSSNEEKTKGNDPKIAILNHDKEVSKNACCKFNFFWWSKLDKENNTPNTIVIMPAPMKDESNSLNIIWNIIGIIIEVPRIICRIPNVKKTVL